ncbi:hypothetical protein TNCV_2137941 [Trichonephila clavipes]|nr:hypothetical protein TNCV_2137941 [Trichonephila clavipes]
MSFRHHIDDFMRRRIIGKIEEGRKITDVARSSASLTALFHGCGSHLKLLECSRRHGEGRVRSMTPAEDRYIILSANRNRRTTAQQVANQFLAASGKKISRKTVARRLRGGDYTHADLLCVSHSPDSTVLPVCNGVVSITIGLNRTGHAYYPQMRVSSVCHRIVDAN